MLTPQTLTWAVLLWVVTAWIFHRFFALAVALYLVRPLVYLFLAVGSVFTAMSAVLLVVRIKLTRVAFPEVM